MTTFCHLRICTQFCTLPKIEQFVAQLLGLHIPTGDRNAINLEVILFPRHFKIIQRKNLYQSQLAARIDTLSAQILPNEKKPKKFAEALKVALMQEANRSSEKVRKLFQRYYNMNGQSLKEAENECFRPALALVNSAKSQNLIREMMTDFRLYLKNFARQGTSHCVLLPECIMNSILMHIL